MSTETENMDEASPPEGASKRPEKRLRRATRYQRVQDRKAAQARSDSRLYGAMFALMSIVALLAILIGAIMVNGGSVDTSGMANIASPWLGPFSQLEVIGLVFVALIAALTYMRMRKR